MKHRIFISVLTIAAICIYKVSFSQYVKETRLTYVRNEKGMGAGDDKVRCYIKIDTSQTLSEAGLRFSLRLKNTQGDSIKIGNILNIFNPSLVSDSGVNVLYPTATSMHGRTGPIEFKSFIVDYVAINGEPIADDDSIGTKMNIVIPPLGNYEVFFRIIKVIKNKAPLPHKFDDAITLLPGRYIFQLSLAVLNGSKFEQFRLNLVKVNYKACPR